MRMPGFTAEASTYKSNIQYHVTHMTNQVMDIGGRVTLAAGTCSCTDPGCTWSCPAPPIDPCGCDRLHGCARIRCDCECNGGSTESAPSAPCGFVCGPF
jgi:hypothetical protein